MAKVSVRVSYLPSTRVSWKSTIISKNRGFFGSVMSKRFTIFASTYEVLISTKFQHDWANIAELVLCRAVRRSRLVEGPLLMDLKNLGGQVGGQYWISEKLGGPRPPLFVRPCYVIANFGMCTQTLNKKIQDTVLFIACVHLFKELCYYMLSFSLKWWYFSCICACFNEDLFFSCFNIFCGMHTLVFFVHVLMNYVLFML